jgi:hypothetical protein
LTTLLLVRPLPLFLHNYRPLMDDRTRHFERGELQGLHSYHAAPP